MSGGEGGRERRREGGREEGGKQGGRALTSRGRCLPGSAGTPVMKSEVMNALITAALLKGERCGRDSG